MSTRTLDELETARMTGARMRPEHARDLAQLMQDPRIARTLSPRGGAPGDEQVRLQLERHVAHWDRHGFGLWMLYDRRAAALIGRGGLLHTTVTGVPEVEVGWAIVPARWRQGLATELALASLEVAFGSLGLESVIAYTLLDNHASRRVMHKSGFVHEREFVHLQLPHVLYRASRADAPTDRVLGTVERGSA